MRLTQIPNVSPFQTATWIYNQGEKAVKNPKVFMLARSIVREVRENDALSEALSIEDFVRARVRFTQDPRSVELVFGPEAMVNLIGRYGKWGEDCDSIVSLTYALLRSIGHQPRILIADFGRAGAIPWPEHIFVQDFIGGAWYTLDGAEKEKTPLMLADIKRFWTFGPAQ